MKIHGNAKQYPYKGAMFYIAELLELPECEATKDRIKYRLAKGMPVELAIKEHINHYWRSNKAKEKKAEKIKKIFAKPVNIMKDAYAAKGANRMNEMIKFYGGC